MSTKAGFSKFQEHAGLKINVGDWCSPTQTPRGLQPNVGSGRILTGSQRFSGSCNSEFYFFILDHTPQILQKLTNLFEITTD